MGSLVKKEDLLAQAKMINNRYFQLPCRSELRTNSQK
jgi:hypothetical protein